MTKIRNENVHFFRCISTDILYFQFKAFENLNFDIVSYFVFRTSDLS